MDHIGYDGSLTVLWYSISLINISTYTTNFIDIHVCGTSDVSWSLPDFMAFLK